NGGTQISVEKNTAVNLVNCLIIATPKTIGVEADNAKLERCTIANAKVGLKATTGVKINNSLISGCKISLLIDAAAMGNASLVRTIVGEGKIDVGGKSFTPSDWPAEIKGLKTDGFIFAADQLSLTEPFYLLPPESPYFKSGENDTSPGARLLNDKKQ
ncbi:MAG: hypothetical protein WC637_06505, partial [Victivallales bacterium]